MRDGIATLRPPGKDLRVPARLVHDPGATTGDRRGFRGPRSRPTVHSQTDAVTLGVKVNPQRLRRGVGSIRLRVWPIATFAALLAGHSPAVASRWYLGVVLKRVRGSSLLAAMGLAPIIQTMAEQTKAVSAAS